MEVHKHEEGIYNILYFDKYGRHIKELDSLKSSLSEAINLGKTTKTNNETVKSFLVKRNIYNSLNKNEG